MLLRQWLCSIVVAGVVAVVGASSAHAGPQLTVTPRPHDFGTVRLTTTVSQTFTVEKLVHKAEANVHLSGNDLHAEAVDGDMYAALDALADKLDRMVVKHKEMRSSHRPENGGIRRAAAPI